MANITRYNPLSPMDEMFDELTRGFFVRPLALPRQQQDLQIKLDIKEDEKAYKIKADIPGVKKEDIHVDVEGNHISLSAETKAEREEKEGGKTLYTERTYGMVSRAFDLPTDVDAEACKAEYKDGVLNLTLPKKNGGATRRISVR
jgi:HSP20 family protein